MVHCSFIIQNRKKNQSVKSPSLSISSYRDEHTNAHTITHTHTNTHIHSHTHTKHPHPQNKHPNPQHKHPHTRKHTPIHTHTPVPSPRLLYTEFQIDGHLSLSLLQMSRFLCHMTLLLLVAVALTAAQGFYSQRYGKRGDSNREITGESAVSSLLIWGDGTGEVTG